MFLVSSCSCLYLICWSQLRMKMQLEPCQQAINAPTTSEWSTILLPTKVWLTLEGWQELLLTHWSCFTFGVIYHCLVQRHQSVSLLYSRLGSHTLFLTANQSTTLNSSGPWWVKLYKPCHDGFTLNLLTTGKEPSGSKPLPEPVLTQICDAIWHYWATMSKLALMKPVMFASWWLVTPYSNIDLGQHWLRLWFVAWQYQTINCLVQCWLIISKVLWHLAKGNFTGNFQDIYPWYEFENY